jgi:hypothetical protein
MTRSITTWVRLEPQSTGPDAGPDPGLEARVYDPAWLLARQWQLGELSGEDAASPAWVRARVAVSPFTRLRRGSDPDAPVHRLEAGDLLEPLVEAETDAAADWTQAAQAGAHVLAALQHAGLDRYAASFRAAFPLPDPGGLGLDPAGVRRLRLLRRGGLDGAALAAAVRAPASSEGAVLPAAPPVAAEDRQAVLEVLRGWLGWHAAAHPGASRAWVAERFEYTFSVAARRPGGDIDGEADGSAELVFDAPEHGGGRLDWTDLVLRPGAAPMGAAGDAPGSQVVAGGLPAPVTYPGMPSNRWWEFEDGRVWFGGVTSEAADLARLLLVQFASVHGNDWFHLPVDLEVGSVALVTALVVVDTFGQSTLVAPASVPDWRMFHVSGAPASLLVVPPVVGSSLEGSAVEEVLLARDEGANLAWAVERRVTGPAGNVIDRYEQARGPVPVATAPEGVDEYYRVMSAVPEHWIPLVPRADGLRSIRLHRGTMVRGDGTEVRPLGRLLEPERPLMIFEEEVPRSGLLVTRAWQLARSADGRTWTWIGRWARPGRGEAASNLRFDALHHASSPEPQ